MVPCGVKIPLQSRKDKFDDIRLCCGREIMDRGKHNAGPLSGANDLWEKEEWERRVKQSELCLKAFIFQYVGSERGVCISWISKHLKEETSAPFVI